jgi:hypothetical protein
VLHQYRYRVSHSRGLASPLAARTWDRVGPSRALPLAQLD